jgi:hypothetical protein
MMISHTQQLHLFNKKSKTNSHIRVVVPKPYLESENSPYERGKRTRYIRVISSKERKL